MTTFLVVLQIALMTERKSRSNLKCHFSQFVGKSTPIIGILLVAMFDPLEGDLHKDA